VVKHELAGVQPEIEIATGRAVFLLPMEIGALPEVHLSGFGMGVAVFGLFHAW